MTRTPPHALLVAGSLAGLMAAGVLRAVRTGPAGTAARPDAHHAAAAQDFPNVDYDGRFTFVRLSYAISSLRGFGFGRRRQAPWAHDYPRAERNFMSILRETTFITPFMEGSNIFSMDDPELYRFPLAYLSEPGYWNPNDEEVEGLRKYLLKGGFLIADDFREGDWYNLEAQMGRVLPEARWVLLDESHAIFDSFFRIESLEPLTSYGRVHPTYLGIFEDNDPEKRLLVIANYNNDIGEYWEFSDTGFQPIDLTNEAYKLGVNYVVYALTH